MNDLRLLAELVRRGCLWYARHGVASTLGRVAGLARDRRGPTWRSYLRWIDAEGAGNEDCDATAGGAGDPAPRLSILVPVHDPPPELLAALVASVRAQDEPRWELCLADDGCRDAAVVGSLEALAREDPRIRCVRLPAAAGISAATNAAAAVARGEVLVFADHDDLLARGVLGRIARAFARDRELDLAYTDEDQLTAWGLRVRPSFKPGRSPFLLLGMNYVTHLVAVRRALFEALGGLRPAFDGSQDHDLLLRAFEAARSVRRLPDIGYHWRRSPASVAATSTAKPWAFEAGRRAVEDACRRRALPVAHVRHGALPGVYTLQPRPLAAPPACDVVLRGPDRGCAGWTLVLGGPGGPLRARSITRNAWPTGPADLPLLVVDATTEPDTSALSALLPWTAMPGVGAVAAPAGTLRRRRDLGYSVTRAGYGQPILAGLPAAAAGPGLLACSVREVAAAGGGLLWVAPPPPNVASSLAGTPATLASELCLSMAHAPAGLATLLLPACRPLVARGALPAAPPVDLSACPAWAPIAAALPPDFWEQDADRFCPRHELLTELGLPAPAAAAAPPAAPDAPGRSAQSSNTSV